MRAPRAVFVRLSFLVALVSPLEQSPGLTSGFGEYRDGRFHAGIDYSTENRTGRPVRAVADGWVERVRASGVGYGRSVYLRLADGRTAVYGHLSRFAPALDAWVTAKQDSTGQYEQDLYPPSNAFRFRQGEVLAFSGESGAGPPHLHLEIRRGDMNLHPLRQGIALGSDATPPSINAVTLVPAGTRGRVGGGIDSWRGTFAKSGELTAPIVSGAFRLQLDTFDRFVDRPNHVATYRLRATLDGASVFEAVLDSMSWDEMPIADRVFDLAATQAGMTDRRLLQSTPNDRSGIVRRGVPVWSLTPGTHRIEFIAEDEAGNVTTRALRVEVAESAPAVDRRVRAELVDDARPGRPAWTVRDLALLVAARSGDAEPGIVDDQRYELADSAAVAGGTVWALVPKGTLTVGLPDVVRAKEAGGYRLGGNGDPWFSWDSLAFHEPVVLLARADTLAGSPGDDLVPVDARHVTLEPRDLALARAIRVSWKGDPATARGRGFGIFRRAGSRGWSLVARADAGGVASGTTRRLGTFALLADTTAPRLVPPSRYAPRANQPAPAFSVRLSDQGSGLAAADQRVLYDGRRVPAEYDPEAGRLTWRPRAPLSAGVHEIVVEAVDVMGNRSSVRVPVAVR